MAKEIILYNLAPHVSDNEYEAYVESEKGPLMDSLKSVVKFELVRIAGTVSGEIPYRYVGIMHLTSLDDFYKNDASSERFKAFLAKWKTMVSDYHIVFGDEIH